ncbi:TonB-dependent receptor plug domain-containing protein [Acinetobacter sp. UBA6526]|uniref:TonB-dependent receptor plug domain-containing protein n=1 Tax=Acinetobacter sp. UBA6526 TaxID=1945950 RepID=UPI00257E4CFF|nr:TonB-dependent receptor plug domain-containing protein [Acinetobacter sp. UBA6526]
MNKYIKYTILGAALALLNTFAYAQTVEEVTVTAARKTQSVQDVAISVQALDGDDLREQHITTGDDLAERLPGYGYSQAIGSGIATKVRGLLIPTIGAAQVAAVQYNINGHTQSVNSLAEAGFLDLERLEVLEGPQGTLYGRNTTTGLVNAITNKPGAPEYLDLSFGADGLTNFAGAYNFALSDSAFARIAFKKYDKDGTIFNTVTSNDVDSRDSYALRLTMDYELEDDSTFRVMYSRNQINDSRQNLGAPACKRDEFFGCSPFPGDPYSNINSPVHPVGLVNNTFNTLMLIAPGVDTYAEAAAASIPNIDTIQKTRDPSNSLNHEQGQLEYFRDLEVGSGDIVLNLKATYQDTTQAMYGDNDHSHSIGSTGQIGNALIPQGSLAFASLPTVCYGTMTNVTRDESFECTFPHYHSEQYELNLVSDFDGRHNFVFGAYNFQSVAFNPYWIQTIGYLAMNDFGNHPMSALFGGALDGYGGQAFAKALGGTLASSAIQTGLASLGATPTTTQVATFLTTNAVPVIQFACTAAAGTDSTLSAAENNTCIKDMPAEAGGLINDQRTHRDTMSIFGEYYLDVTDNFKLTFGVRYNDDRYWTQSMQGLSDGAYSGAGNTVAAACNAADYEACYQAGASITTDKQEESMYKFVTQYFYDQGQVYASYTTGNRPGGANPDTTKYDGSESTQIEIGTKNILFDGAMRLNLTAFSMEMEKGQFSQIRVSSAYTELHDFTHEGVSLNVQAYVTPTTIVSLGALYLDSTMDTVAPTAENTYSVVALGGIIKQGSQSIDPHNPTQATSFTNLATNAALAAAYQQAGLSAAAASAAADGIDDACAAIFGAALCGQSTYSMDNKGNVLMNPQGLAFPICSGCSEFKEVGGNQVPFAAELESNVALTQLYSGFGGSGAISLMYSFKDEHFSDWYNQEKHKVPAAEFWNLTASYSPDNADWYVNLWANNLRDKRQITSLQGTSNLQGQNIFTTFSEGMRAGLDFGLNF